MMSMRERIIGKQIKLKEKQVSLWGETFILRALTAGQKELIDVAVNKSGEIDQKELRARYIIASCYDVDTRLFHEGDISWLRENANADISGLFSEILDLNGATSVAIEQAEKN